MFKSFKTVLNVFIFLDLMKQMEYVVLFFILFFIVFFLKVLASALTECHKQSSAAGSPLRLKVFIAGRNRLENNGATALAKAFKVLRNKVL